MDGNASYSGDSEKSLDFDKGSMDGNASYKESSEDGSISEDEFEGEYEAKVDRWYLGQDEIKDRIVEPEHFDNTSFLTHSNETFVTKDNYYKFAPSALTRVIETYSEVEAPSKHFAKKTTLLLMACRTNNWPIVGSILDIYTLLTDVNYKDSNGSNALHMAIKANQIDICNKMIETINMDYSKRHLKSEVNVDGKNALMLVTEMIIQGGHHEFEIVEKNIIKTTGQKMNPYRNTNPQVEVDKSKVQTLQLFRGTSCGFYFEYKEPSVWICIGENCQVEVLVEDDFSMGKTEHYNNRHKCKTEVKVKHRKGTILLDQFEFSYIEDSDGIEIWNCKREGCGAIIELNIKTDLVESHWLHSCIKSLNMEVDKQYSLLGGYVFCKDQECNGQKSTWYCTGQGCKGQKKGCKITVTGDDLKLAYHHTSGMHKCNDYKQTGGNEAEKGSVEEDDGDMFMMFGEDDEDGGEMFEMFGEEDDGEMFGMFE